MYKVYDNGSLNLLYNHCYAILINGLHVPSPLFADDIYLLTLHPSFLKMFMIICNYRHGTNEGMTSIILKVVLLHLARLSRSIFYLSL